MERTHFDQAQSAILDSNLGGDEKGTKQQENRH